MITRTTSPSRPSSLADTMTDGTRSITGSTSNITSRRGRHGDLLQLHLHLEADRRQTNTAHGHLDRGFLRSARRVRAGTKSVDRQLRQRHGDRLDRLSTVTDKTRPRPPWWCSGPYASIRSSQKFPTPSPRTPRTASATLYTQHAWLRRRPDPPGQWRPSRVCGGMPSRSPRPPSFTRDVDLDRRQGRQRGPRASPTRRTVTSPRTTRQTALRRPPTWTLCRPGCHRQPQQGCRPTGVTDGKRCRARTASHRPGAHELGSERSVDLATHLHVQQQLAPANTTATVNYGATAGTGSASLRNTFGGLRRRRRMATRRRFSGPTAPNLPASNGSGGRPGPTTSWNAPHGQRCQSSHNTATPLAPGRGLSVEVPCGAGPRQPRRRPRHTRRTYDWTIDKRRSRSSVVPAPRPDAVSPWSRRRSARRDRLGQGHHGASPGTPGGPSPHSSR